MSKSTCFRSFTKYRPNCEEITDTYHYFYVRQEQEYLNFKRHGKQYSYNNDKLSLYQEMAFGKENGITKSFDENGNLTEETIYENGKEISRKKYK